MQPDQQPDPVTAYARDVVEGRVRVGRAVRLACERHLRDLVELTARGYVFSAALAQHAIGFFPKFLRLAEGEFAGRPFVLQPWQEFIVGSLFGWLGPDGFRRFRTAYVEIGKGNGKTPMAAGIGLYGMLFDDEESAEIYAAAVNRDQARIMFLDAKKMAEASPDLAARLEIMEHSISHEDSDSVFRPVSSEGRGLDGKRVHMALIDEIHEHRSPVVVTKMRKGTKARRNALILEITNSGYDRQSICFEHHEQSIKVLERTLENETWFAYVCQLDVCETCRGAGKIAPSCERCDQFTDETVWIKANPNLGVSIQPKYLRELVDEALGMPTVLNDLLRLNFCVWTEAVRRWIDMDRWNACSGDVSDVELVGVPCYAGLDLGLGDDFSAFVRVFLVDELVVVRARFWIPEATLERYVKTKPYLAVWHREGLLTVTPGTTSDEDAIEAEVARLCEESAVLQLGYDKRFAHQMATHLEGLGIETVDTPQGFLLNEALRDIEKRVKDGTLRHGGDPIMRWMASNAVVIQGQRLDIRLDKAQAGDKIDGIAALAMALDCVVKAPAAKEPRVTVIG